MMEEEQVAVLTCIFNTEIYVFLWQSLFLFCALEQHMRLICTIFSKGRTQLTWCTSRSKILARPKLAHRYLHYCSLETCLSNLTYTWVQHTCLRMQYVVGVLLHILSARQGIALFRFEPCHWLIVLLDTSNVPTLKAIYHN